MQPPMPHRRQRATYINKFNISPVIDAIMWQQCSDGSHKHAFWKGGRCSTWELPQSLSTNGITVAWCDDIPALVAMLRACRVFSVQFGFLVQLEGV